MKTALQLYSVRDFAEKDFYGTLAGVKDMGYDGVEFAGLYGRAPAEVAAEVRKLGLAPVSAHVPIDDMLSDPDGVIGGYAGLGCRLIAVPYLPPERRPGTDGFARTLRDIESLSKTAKKFDMRMLYHNHDFEFHRIDGKYALDLLYDTIPAELLGTEIDTCWVNVGGEDPAAYVLKYAGRAPVVHWKDFYMKKRDRNAPSCKLLGRAPGRDPDFEFRPVGYGVQDFPAILEVSEKAGAEWGIVEQDAPSMGKNSMECAAMSLDYLKTLL